MPGDYTDEEVQNLSTAEFTAAKARRWKKPESTTHINLGTSVPPSGVYGSSWGSGPANTFDFICPSGERCLMRPIPIEALLEEGILDEVSRLEGLADALIKQSEGEPPTATRLPSREEFGELLKVINTVTRLAVVKPHVHADDTTDPVPEGSIAVSQIGLGDRTAIMERSLSDLRKLDKFRYAG